MGSLGDLCRLGLWCITAVLIAWVLVMVWDFIVYYLFASEMADELEGKDCYEPPKDYDAPEDR